MHDACLLMLQVRSAVSAMASNAPASSHGLSASSLGHRLRVNSLGDSPAAFERPSSSSGVDWPENALFCASWMDTDKQTRDVFETLI